MLLETTVPVLSVLLCLSEILPLLKKFESNGILDMAIRFCKSISSNSDPTPLLSENSLPPTKYYDGSWFVRSRSEASFDV